MRRRAYNAELLVGTFLLLTKDMKSFVIENMLRDENERDFVCGGD